jgi:hypothetical protein
MQQTTTAAATAAIALHTEHSNNSNNSHIFSIYTSINNSKMQRRAVVQDGETGLALSSLRAACTDLPLDACWHSLALVWRFAGRETADENVGGLGLGLRRQA